MPNLKETNDQISNLLRLEEKAEDKKKKKEKERNI